MRTFSAVSVLKHTRVNLYLIAGYCGLSLSVSSGILLMI